MSRGLPTGLVRGIAAINNLQLRKKENTQLEKACLSVLAEMVAFYDLPHEVKTMPAIESLSPREREVVQFICRGRTAKETGSVLGISARTVEAHRANAFHKLDVRNAIELATLFGSDFLDARRH